MLMPDVNILVYAHREEEKCHGTYAKWLKTLIDGAQPVVFDLVAVVARSLRIRPSWPTIDLA